MGTRLRLQLDAFWLWLQRRYAVRIEPPSVSSLRIGCGFACSFWRGDSLKLPVLSKAVALEGGTVRLRIKMKLQKKGVKIVNKTLPDGVHKLKYDFALTNMFVSPVAARNRALRGRQAGALGLLRVEGRRQLQGACGRTRRQAQYEKWSGSTSYDVGRSFSSGQRVRHMCPSTTSTWAWTISSTARCLILKMASWMAIWCWLA